MHSYPTPALIQVKSLTDIALSDSARAVAFQGAPGCNSHRAALEYAPDCLPLPCFAFEDALDAVRDGKADRALIPIENSLHGRVADMHFLLPESGLSIIGEYFLTGIAVPGYATIVVGMMFFSGIQLLSIGILAEYVGRIYEEVKQRPNYLISQRTGSGLPAPQQPADPA